MYFVNCLKELSAILNP